jgi:hypothetical protein
MVAAHAIFRRSGVMIESPWLKEVLEESNAETQRQSLMGFLIGRFTDVPNDLKVDLQRVNDPSQLLELIRWAARCPDLDAFVARLKASI